MAETLGWPPTRVDAASALGMATGCVGELQDRDGCRLALRTRGRYFLEALESARNEGEKHCGLLADAAAYLFHLGLQVQIVRQEGGYLRPDAEVDWRGRTYSVEVECSTLVTHLEQVARNLRKAFALGRRVLVVVENREDAGTFARVLRKEIPEAEIWGEVGLMWCDGVESMVPYDFGPRKPWGFLPGGIDYDTDESEIVGPPRMAEAIRAAVNDPRASDLARVDRRARDLLAAGRWEVTADEFNGVFGGDMPQPADRVRLGLPLETLGVRKYRARRAGQEKSTYYELRTLLGPDEGGPGAAGTPSEPVRGASDTRTESGRESEPPKAHALGGGQGWTDGQTYGKGRTRNPAPTGRPDESTTSPSNNQGNSSASQACRESGETSAQPAPSTGHGEDP